MKKAFIVGGFTQKQREKELEKVKDKYSKKGYKFIEYIESGAMKSTAMFEVDASIIKKERSKQLIVIGLGFLLIAAILFIKSTGAAI